MTKKKTTIKKAQEALRDQTPIPAVVDALAAADLESQKKKMMTAITKKNQAPKMKKKKTIKSLE